MLTTYQYFLIMLLCELMCFLILYGYVQVYQQQQTFEINDGSPKIELAAKVFHMFFIEVLKKYLTLHEMCKHINDINV